MSTVGPKTAHLALGFDYMWSPYKLGDCKMDMLSMISLIGANSYHASQSCSFADAATNAELLGGKLGEKDIFYFTYSGHGTKNSKGETLLVFDRGDSIEYVSDSAIETMFSGLKCQIVCIYDCCFAAGLKRDLADAGHKPKYMPYDSQYKEVEYWQHRMMKAPYSLEMFASSENESAISTGKGGAFSLGLARSVSVFFNRKAGYAFEVAKKYCLKYQHPEMRVSLKNFNPILFKKTWLP